MQRLKQEEQDALWAISYADLMSLLLAVFVLIAAMGELKTGLRFASMRSAVRSAFGFEAAGAAISPPLAPRPLTLAQQMAKAGLVDSSALKPKAPDEVLRCCDLSVESNRLVIRIAGGACFDRFSAALRPEGQAAIQRLADFLQGGKARIEVRGFNGDGRPGATSMYRDGLDLSYSRARAVVDALARGGVEPGRIYVSACGDQDPLASPAPDGALAAANRRIEIVVHAVRVFEGNDQFAEKGQHENAQ